MSGNQYFDENQGLMWREDIGMGYLELTETPYDKAYFDKYVAMAETEMGEELTWARLNLVKKWFPDGSIVDIGIGSGQFMDAIGCYGFDVNPTAIELLNSTNNMLDPHFEDVDCATFWDSLEHIPEISQILFHVKQFAFVSLTIFKNPEHIIGSRHFRPDEHCWYFTDEGFQKFMYAHGFKVVEQNIMETDIGREDIGTYACQRMAHGGVIKNNKNYLMGEN